MDLILNIAMLAISIVVVFIFARKSAVCFLRVKEQIELENDFYTELILGLESVGQNVCRPQLLKRETRISIWELYNNIRVQPRKENKTIVLQRKILEKKQTLFRNLEEAKVNLEILPFLGILATLLAFAIPYLMKIAQGTSVIFDVTGVGFFFAGNIMALLALTYLKKKYEADIMAQFDYYECQQKSMEKIMVEQDGFHLLEVWLHTWPEQFSGNDGTREATEMMELPKNPLKNS